MKSYTNVVFSVKIKKNGEKPSKWLIEKQINHSLLTCSLKGIWAPHNSPKGTFSYFVYGRFSSGIERLLEGLLISYAMCKIRCFTDILFYSKLIFWKGTSFFLSFCALVTFFWDTSKSLPSTINPPTKRRLCQGPAELIREKEKKKEQQQKPTTQNNKNTREICALCSLKWSVAMEKQKKAHK